MEVTTALCFCNGPVSSRETEQTSADIFWGTVNHFFFIRVYGKKISVTNCSQCQKDR